MGASVPQEPFGGADQADGAATADAPAGATPGREPATCAHFDHIL